MGTLISTELLRIAMDGDDRVFRDIVNHNSHLAYKIAYRVIGNAENAEEICQDAFYRLWKMIMTEKVHVDLEAWLCRIIINLCMDLKKSAAYRYNKLNLDLIAAAEVDTPYGPEVEMNTAELLDQIYKATQKLPELQKKVYTLRHIDGLSVEATAIMLSMTKEQVKSNAWHALKNISERLGHIYQTKKIKKQ